MILLCLWVNFQRTQWIASEILSVLNPKNAAKIICKFLSLADVSSTQILLNRKKLIRYGNIHGFMAIYIGLTQNLVSRYEAAWQVCSSKHHASFCKAIPSSMRAKLERFHQLANPIGNFKNIRPLHDIVCQDVIIIKSPGGSFSVNYLHCSAFRKGFSYVRREQS